MQQRYSAARCFTPEACEEVAQLCGVLGCFDAKTGESVWEHRDGGSGHSASLLYADGVVWAFAEDGSAVCFEPARAFKEAGRGKLGDTEVMGTPAIAGKAFFVRTKGHVYRLEKR